MTTGLVTKNALLHRLARERRRVVAGWRIAIYLRAEPNGQPDTSSTEARARGLMARMMRRGDLAPVPGVRGVFTVEVPYARTIPTSDEQIIQEACPGSVLSHLTAVAHHALTVEIPRSIHVTQYPSRNWRQRLPLGTTPEDWVSRRRPPAAQPRLIGRVGVFWRQCKAEWDFGHTVAFSQGQPIYVTDIERTLLDSLRDPDACGGMSNTLEAWRRARELLDVSRLVEYADRFGIDVLKARAGFLLESLGLSHERLDEWAASMPRGGSMRLVPGRPFETAHSERWNLSLNLPPDALAIVEAA